MGYNFIRFKNKFLIKNIKAPKKFNYPDVYMEVDKKVDLKFLSHIFKHFLKRGDKYFSLEQILNFIKKRKHLIDINNKVHRRWKKLKK